jgi:hypothetical protein
MMNARRSLYSVVGINQPPKIITIILHRQDIGGGFHKKKERLTGRQMTNAKLPLSSIWDRCGEKGN